MRVSVSSVSIYKPLFVVKVGIDVIHFVADHTPPLKPVKQQGNLVNVLDLGDINVTWFKAALKFCVLKYVIFSLIFGKL
jgi:hypothetical protein